MRTYGETYVCVVGVVNETGRPVNAGHFLFWRALVEAKRLGHRWFDLGGMHPSFTPPGIFHFKAGVGGSAYQLVGEMEASMEAGAVE